MEIQIKSQYLRIFGRLCKCLSSSCINTWVWCVSNAKKGARKWNWVEKIPIPIIAFMSRKDATLQVLSLSQVAETQTLQIMENSPAIRIIRWNISHIQPFLQK